MDDTEMVVAVEELRAWLHSFDPDSLVQLDYGGLTRAIPFEDLVADHSAAEVWEALGALEAGDLDRSSELYRTLSERWSALGVGNPAIEVSAPLLALAVGCR